MVLVNTIIDGKDNSLSFLGFSKDNLEEFQSFIDFGLEFYCSYKKDIDKDIVRESEILFDLSPL